MIFDLAGIFFVYFLFFYRFFIFVFYNVHYLILLLLLEGLLLRSFLLLGISFLYLYGLVGLFVFLLVVVCIGGFGISLLVSVSRFHGRDF